MLPHTEVINLGVHGYGHDQMLILLKEEGVKYEPDIVILGFMPIDMSRNLLKFRDFAKPRFILKGGKLKFTGSPVPRPEDILRWDWARIFGPEWKGAVHPVPLSHYTDLVCLGLFIKNLTQIMVLFYGADHIRG